MTVYGRIDISHPDGRRESYLLANEATTIGSAADDTIQAPKSCLAKGQIRIARDVSGATISNRASEPSLTVDGLPLPVNQSLRLGATANIRAGPLRIQYTGGSDLPTVAMPAFTEQTRPSTLGFRASLASGSLKVWPYSSASTELSIANLTDDSAQFVVETRGLPSAWTTPSQIALTVERADTADFLIHITPPAGLDQAPGDYPLILDITRLGELESRAQLALVVQLGSCAGLSLALDPPNALRQQAFSLHLRNLGNDDLALKLAAFDKGSLLNLSLAQGEIRLQPKGRAAINGSVAPRRRPLVGKTREIPFALLAKATDPNGYVVALPASAAVKPLVSQRAFIAAASAIVAFFLAIAALLYQPPQPSISSFTLSEKQVAQGTPVSLAWAAANAERFVIEVERAPLVELPAEAVSYKLETGDYHDPIDIALIAINGDETDIRSLRLDLYKPVTIHQFATDKANVVRGIGAELKIAWHVTGAVALDVALPDGFETSEAPIVGEEGEFVISGEADAAFQISLKAVDEQGQIIERAIAIAVIEPECAPTEDTQLYAGPDPRYRRANYAQRNVPVLVNGLAAGRDWLQVELANGDTGWGRLRSFICAGFDPAKLKVISDYPPLPTDTATATIPATASLNAASADAATATAASAGS